jgi:hypothetical protein
MRNPSIYLVVSKNLLRALFYFNSKILYPIYVPFYNNLYIILNNLKDLNLVSFFSLYFKFLKLNNDNLTKSLINTFFPLTIPILKRI